MIRASDELWLVVHVVGGRWLGRMRAKMTGRRRSSRSAGRESAHCRSSSRWDHVRASGCGHHRCICVVGKRLQAPRLVVPVRDSHLLVHPMKTFQLLNLRIGPERLGELPA